MVETSTGYWAYLASPRSYDIERLLADGVRVDRWPINKSDIGLGDRIAIWKALGGRARRQRGIVALATVIGDPEWVSDDDNPYWKNPQAGSPAWRAPVRYVVPDGLPLWLDGPAHDLLDDLTVRNGQGAGPYHLSAEQWDRLVGAAGAWSREDKNWIKMGEPHSLPDEGSKFASHPVPRSEASGHALRARTIVDRLVRDGWVARRVKALHANTCQICGIRIDTPLGPYAEAAHVVPLGSPHDGPDLLANVMCLCPNDHVRFDSGALVIDEDQRIVDTATGQAVGVLRTVPGHEIAEAFLTYHRVLWTVR